MKISEEKALEEYPKETYYDRDVCDYVDVNATRRDAYIKGYDQAMKDFFERVEEFFNDMYDTMVKPALGKKTIELFKNHMQDE
jgi:hypothetical protein